MTPTNGGAVSLGLALLVYVAFKIAGKGDALEGYDLLGRKKEPKE